MLTSLMKVTSRAPNSAASHPSDPDECHPSLCESGEVSLEVWIGAFMPPPGVGQTDVTVLLLTHTYTHTHQFDVYGLKRLQS